MYFTPKKVSEFDMKATMTQFITQENINSWSNSFFREHMFQLCGY